MSGEAGRDQSLSKLILRKSPGLVKWEAISHCGGAMCAEPSPRASQPREGKALSTAKNVYAAGITVPGTVPLTLPGLVPAARPQPRRPISAQPQLPFPRYRPALVQRREIRSAFHPPAARSGGYTLPKAAQDRLTTSLRGFRNREAAFALAVFLARYWSAPGRIELAFTVDRRALDEHGELGLTPRRGCAARSARSTGSAMSTGSS